MRMSRKLAMRCGGIPLKTLAVGSSVWLNENETAAEYIVLAHDYPVSGGTLVMRKIAIGSITMNASTPTTYVAGRYHDKKSKRRQHRFKTQRRDKY